MILCCLFGQGYHTKLGAVIGVKPKNLEKSFSSAIRSLRVWLEVSLNVLNLFKSACAETSRIVLLFVINRSKDFRCCRRMSTDINRSKDFSCCRRMSTYVNRSKDFRCCRRMSTDTKRCAYTGKLSEKYFMFYIMYAALSNLNASHSFICSFIH
jgi:hypothetical protein